MNSKLFGFNFKTLICVFGLFIHFFQIHGQKVDKQYTIDYSLWDEILQEYVNAEGFVDYKKLKKDQDRLLKFTDYLSQNEPEPHWSIDKKKAYFINLYNAYTLLLVLEHYPVDSIKDIGGFMFSAFKKDFIPYKGQLVSLDFIEKKVLLNMGDARVHFAINCASFSCPKLLNKAYKAENIDKQLDECTRDFLESSKNKITVNHLELSKIFKWYKKDFETSAGSLIDFIESYIDIDINKEASREYLDYDWRLNSIENY